MEANENTQETQANQTDVFDSIDPSAMEWFDAFFFFGLSLFSLLSFIIHPFIDSLIDSFIFSLLCHGSSLGMDGRNVVAGRVLLLLR